MKDYAKKEMLQQGVVTSVAIRMAKPLVVLKFAIVLSLIVVGMIAQSTSQLLAKESESKAMGSEATVAEGLSNTFRRAQGIVQPTVVSISIEKKDLSPYGTRDYLPEIPDEFRRFFGDDFGRFYDRPNPGKRGVQRGFGSGVIVSPDGYILTNNHVVAGADNLSVRLQDESTHKAKIIGTDPKTEVAVIKIEIKGLTAAKLADSDKVRIGDWVLAIGGPFGLRHTVTAGIVSAKGRDTVGIADYENFIQTDAAINPGNSGGPLINMRGEVIGINTAIATRSGANAGVGFAIPSNMARSIMDALIKDGQVNRGFLGVLVQNLTPELATSFGFEGKHGALLGDVTKGGPADEAKLKAGDIITKFNGVRMESSQQLRNKVASTTPGTKVELEFFRGGRIRAVEITLGRLGDSPVVTDLTGGAAAIAKLGLAVEVLTSELAGQLGFDDGQSGVVVTKVEPGGLAERIGLQVKDLIVSINGKPILTMQDFRNQIGKNDLKRGIRLQVISSGFKRFLFLRSR